MNGKDAGSKQKDLHSLCSWSFPQCKLYYRFLDEENEILLSVITVVRS
jgi:hypothetical protein